MVGKDSGIDDSDDHGRTAPGDVPHTRQTDASRGGARAGAILQVVPLLWVSGVLWGGVQNPINVIGLSVLDIRHRLKRCDGRQGSIMLGLRRKYAHSSL